MSANFNDIIKQDYVKIRNKLGIYLQWWLILRRPSSKGPLRLEKFKNEKETTLMEEAIKSIELKNIHKINRVPRDERKNAVVILFENRKPFQMELSKETEAESWLSILQDTCRISGENAGPPGLDHLSNSNLQNVFHVCLVQTPLLNIYGECLLRVTAESIFLLDVENPSRRFVMWPLNCLRKFSRDTTKFMIESGRSCKTGEGIFIFNSIHSEEIYQKVWSASNTIAEAYRLAKGIRQDSSESRPLPPTPGLSESPGLLPTPGSFSSSPFAPVPPARRF